MLDIAATPKFAIREQRYHVPEDVKLSAFYITEIIPNPQLGKLSVPVERVEEILEGVTEYHDENLGARLRYAVLYDPRMKDGKREEPLTTGWDAFSQPLQPNLKEVRKHWVANGMVVMTFQSIAQVLAGSLGGKIIKS